MKTELAHVALLVPDYDEAIQYYTHVLGFELVADTPLDTNKRWVLVKPPGATGCNLLLARASSPTQEMFIGNQSGGRVFLFLHTNRFDDYFSQLKANGVEIVRGPVREPYGTVAVFKDRYGNLWDLIEPTT